MSKQQTFADKAAKLAKKNAADFMCPKCNKPGKLLHAKVVNSVKTQKNTFKFLERNANLCSNCLAEV
ncbi:MAG: hypothetical protein L0Y77_12805 [Chlorobi bacterium]|nr:hypothetical protein [Chlorobiota bacterium]